MKIWKKNLIAAAVLVTVCAGIYVNWLYAKGQATQTLTESLDTEKVMGEDTLELTDDMAAVMNGEEVDTSGNYFAAVRLSRQQARDDAINLLQEAASRGREGKGAASGPFSVLYIEEFSNARGIIRRKGRRGRDIMAAANGKGVYK